MNRFFTKSIALVALVGAFSLVSATKSEAAFRAAICDDAACSGGGDVIVTDGADDAINGFIDITAVVGDYAVSTNTSKSTPLLTEGMDLAWTATRNSTATGTGDLWFYALDENFLGTPTLHAHIGGTADGDPDSSAIVEASACPSPGACGLSGVLTGPSFSEDFAAGSVSSSPYSLLLMVHITGIRAGGESSGDFRVSVVPVPEPVSLSLFGLGLAGLAIRRRRQNR